MDSPSTNGERVAFLTTATNLLVGVRISPTGIRRDLGVGHTSWVSGEPQRSTARPTRFHSGRRREPRWPVFVFCADGGVRLHSCARREQGPRNSWRRTTQVNGAATVRPMAASLRSKAEGKRPLRLLSTGGRLTKNHPTCSSNPDGAGIVSGMALNPICPRGRLVSYLWPHNLATGLPEYDSSVVIATRTLPRPVGHVGSTTRTLRRSKWWYGKTPMGRSDDGIVCG